MAVGCVVEESAVRVRVGAVESTWAPVIKADLRRPLYPRTFGLLTRERFLQRRVDAHAAAAGERDEQIRAG